MLVATSMDRQADASALQQGKKLQSCQCYFAIYQISEYKLELTQVSSKGNKSDGNYQPKTLVENTTQVENACRA